MRNRLIGIVAAALMFAVSASPEPQNGLIITITAGTAQRFVGKRTMANSILIQALHAGTGIGYVLYAPPSFTCHKGSAGTTLVAEVSAASATNPGGSFSYPTNATATSQAGGFDVQGFCLDGSNSGDTFAVSWDSRN